MRVSHNFSEREFQSQSFVREVEREGESISERAGERVSNRV